MPDQVVPLHDALMPVVEPEKLGDIVLDQRHLDYAEERWPDASDSMRRYRVRQAIWAKIQHTKPHPDDPNRPRLGGAQPGAGRKPKSRLGQAIVEEFTLRQREVMDAIAAPLAPNSGATPMERHKAGMNIARHEREERQMDIVEDEYSRKTEDEVNNDLASVMVELLGGGDITIEDLLEKLKESKSEVPDAEVVEVPARELSA